MVGEGFIEWAPPYRPGHLTDFIHIPIHGNISSKLKFDILANPESIFIFLASTQQRYQRIYRELSEINPIDFARSKNAGSLSWSVLRTKLLNTAILVPEKIILKQNVTNCNFLQGKYYVCSEGIRWPDYQNASFICYEGENHSDIKELAESELLDIWYIGSSKYLHARSDKV